MENVDKVVEFERYCYKCKYYGLDEFREPCHECLNNPTNTNSRKPINFKEVETKDKKKDPVEKKESNIDIYSWSDELKDFYKEER